MKTFLLVATFILLHKTLPAQYQTVLFTSTDEPLQIEIPEGKVVEIRTFIASSASGASTLALEKDGRTHTVLKSAYYEGVDNNPAFCSFAGPSVLRLHPGVRGCLTYRMFDNVEPSLSPPPPARPIVRVRTVCRCRRR